jgi:hypothetical protein
MSTSGVRDAQSDVTDDRTDDDVTGDAEIWYPMRYHADEYTFPTDNTIERARVDDHYLHIELVDRRVLSIPLDWIPSLRDAQPSERAKFTITADRTMLFWDPEESEVNEIVRLSDYLVAKRGRE